MECNRGSVLLNAEATSGSASGNREAGPQRAAWEARRFAWRAKAREETPSIIPRTNAACHQILPLHVRPSGRAGHLVKNSKKSRKRHPARPAQTSQFNVALWCAAGGLETAGRRMPDLVFGLAWDARAKAASVAPRPATTGCSDRPTQEPYRSLPKRAVQFYRCKSVRP